MTIFLRLLAAHMLTDFVFLRNTVFDLCKTNRLSAAALHAAIYAACIIILCWPYMGTPWLTCGGLQINGWVMLLPLIALHLTADVFDRAYLGCPPGYHTLFFILWQIISVSILFLIAPILPAAQITPWLFYFNNFLAVLIGAIFVTYFLMLLLYYIDKDLDIHQFPTPDERYTSMLYRVVLYFLLLLPGFMGVGLGLLWLFFAASAKNARGVDISNIRAYVGTPLTVIAAIFVRVIIFYAGNIA